MRATSLRRLADVCNVSRLDLNPGNVSLIPEDGKLLAYYLGQYSSGAVRVDIPPTDFSTVITRPVSVSAVEFRDLVPLFPEDGDVRLVASDSALTITSGKRRVSLKYNGKPHTDRLADLDNATVTAKVKHEDFLRETAFASQVCATTLVTPVLTGIRIIVTPTRLGVQAANGSSAVFESFMPCKSEGKVEVVMPAQDSQHALRIVEGDVLELCLTDRSATFRTTDAAVKIALVSHPWPKMHALRTLEYVDAVKLPVNALRSLVTAARVYKTSEDVILRPTESNASIVLETKESELGQFQEAIEGQVSATYILDANDLDSASRLSEGDIDLQLGKKMALAQSGTRKLYLTPRAQ